jgi:hypothetical protein
MIKTLLILMLSSTLCFAQNDSIVFNLGSGNLVTIYRNGHEKRLPSPVGNAGKIPQSTGSGWQLVSPSGGGYDGNPSTINQTSSYRFVTDAEKTAWSTKDYTLQVQALTSSPADAATVYFGNLPKALTTTANSSKIYIRQSGTIKRVEIYSYSGTAGTGEAWTLHVRKNNTADTQIASVSLATNERIWSNTNLSIPVVNGDYIEIKAVNPTWATNPLTTIFGGYVYIA